MEDARKVKEIYNIGDHFIDEELSPKLFSRIAAQTAKQVIMQRLNDERKNQVLSEMNEKEGEIVTAIIRRVEKDNVYVEISGSQMEGIMMKNDQIRGERYDVNAIIKVYVKSVRSSDRAIPRLWFPARARDLSKGCSKWKFPKSEAGLSLSRKSCARPGTEPKWLSLPTILRLTAWAAA